MGLLYSCICICVFNILYFVFGVRIKLKIFPLTNQSSRLDDNPPSDWLRLHLIGWDWLRLHLIGYLKNPLSLLGNQEKLNLLSSDWLIYLRILSSVSHWQSRKTTWNMMMRISWKINNKGPRFKLYSLKKICRSTLDRQMIVSAKKSHRKEINKEQLYFVVAMQQMVHVMDLECEKWWHFFHIRCSVTLSNPGWQSHPHLKFISLRHFPPSQYIWSVSVSPCLEINQI